MEKQKSFFERLDVLCIRILHWMLTFSVVISGVLGTVAFTQMDSLPDRREIGRSLYQNPRQFEAELGEIRLTRGGVDYRISPEYYYELSGLVVSYHEAGRFHWKHNDFLNIKDIALVWGDNISTEIYKEVKFRNALWFCETECLTERAERLFKNSCVSNNHLLSGSDQITDKIIEADIGDQVFIKGYLATYYSGGKKMRGSSVSRDDYGCETIYVTDFRILKRANTAWKWTFKIALGVLIVLLFITAVIRLRRPVRLY